MKVIFTNTCIFYYFCIACLLKLTGQAEPPLGSKEMRSAEVRVHSQEKVVGRMHAVNEPCKYVFA